VSGRVGQIAGHDREGRQGFVVDAGREGGEPHHCPRAGLGLIYRAGGHLQMKTDATIDAAAGQGGPGQWRLQPAHLPPPAARLGLARFSTLAHVREPQLTRLIAPIRLSTFRLHAKIIASIPVQ